MGAMRMQTLNLLVLIGSIGPLAACERSIDFPTTGSTWADPPVPAFSSQVRLVTTNNGDDTLSFVSTDSIAAPRLLGTAVIGENPVDLEGPHHLAHSPDGRWLYYNLSNYVINGGSGPHGAHGSGSLPGYLVKLDARTYRTVGKVLVDRSPGDVIVSADGKRVFVSHYDLARFNDQLLKGRPVEEGYSAIAIIDADTMQQLSLLPICPTAHGEGLSLDQKRLYVTCSLTDELAVIDVQDPRAPQVERRVKIGPQSGGSGDPRYSPYALIVHPTDGMVWISSTKSNDVRVYDPAQQKMLDGRTVQVGGSALFGAWSQDKQTLYIPTQNPDQLVAIELATGATHSLTLPATGCLNAHAVTLTPLGAAVVCEGDHLVRRGSVVLVDLAHWAIGGTVEIGLFPDSATILPSIVD